jgi:hypothetical protein
VIHFAAKRISESEVVEGNLRCELPMSDKSLKKHLSRLRPFQILEVEVEDDKDAQRIVLSKITKTDVPDQALADIATRLQKPVVVHDAVLGELTLEREFSSYSGRATWIQQEVDIDLECAAPDEPQSAIEKAVELLESQEKWQNQIDACAVSQLLELKNGGWRDEGEAEVSRSDFLKRMSLETISICHDGNFSFWFDDGDLFSGHAIVVAGNIETGVDRADIAG